MSVIIPHFTIVGKMDPALLPKSRIKIRQEHIDREKRKAEERLQRVENQRKLAEAEQKKLEQNIAKLAAQASKKGWKVRASNMSEKVDRLFDAIFDTKELA